MNDQTRENAVEVDQAELDRELDQALPPPTPHGDEGGGAGAPTTSDAPATIPTAASWTPVSPAIVQLVDLFVCPAWKLTPQEKDALTEALAPALDQLFPGGLGDERWAPYARLALVATGIALSRFDRATGRLAPLRESARPPAADPDAEPAAAPGDAGAAAPGVPFTLGAGS